MCWIKGSCKDCEYSILFDLWRYCIKNEIFVGDGDVCTSFRQRGWIDEFVKSADSRDF